MGSDHYPWKVLRDEKRGKSIWNMKMETVRKNCKVLRWEMDSASGDGEIVFVVPSMMPEVCDVVVDPYGALPETEEQDGFTVKAPEIVSVDSECWYDWK